MLELPNYTQFPNVILDAIDTFKEAELKVIAIVVRETFGFHRESCKLTIPVLIQRTGLSDESIRKALRSLADREIISRDQKRDGSEIKLNLTPKNFDPPKILTPKNFDPQTPKILTPDPKNFDPQNDLTPKNFDPQQPSNVDTPMALESLNKPIGLKESFKETLSKESERESEKSIASLSKSDPQESLVPVKEKIEPPTCDNKPVEDEYSAAPQFLNSTEKNEVLMSAPWNQDYEAFLGYLQKIYLPSVPSYQGKTVQRSTARQWLNKARYDRERYESAEIQWEAYQEHLGRIAESQPLRPVATSTCAAIDPEKAPKYAQLRQQLEKKNNGLSA